MPKEFDISGLGFSAVLIASGYFPSGFPINQFSLDSDPLDGVNISPSKVILDVNGNAIAIRRPQLIPVKFSIIPCGADETYLDALFSANTPAHGKKINKDILTLIMTYADGTIKTLTGGTCGDYTPFRTIDSRGKYRPREYNFTFTDIKM